MTKKKGTKLINIFGVPNKIVEITRTNSQDTLGAFAITRINGIIKLYVYNNK